MKELENLGIKTPTGKDTWSKGTIDAMLSNEKYIGVLRLLDKGKHEVHYVSEKNIHLLFLKKDIKWYSCKI